MNIKKTMDPRIMNPHLMAPREKELDKETNYETIMERLFSGKLDSP